MNSYYQTWLQEEKRWIGAYGKKTMCRSILQVVPATLIFLFLFFGAMACVNGGGSTAFFTGAVGGLCVGIFVCGFYLLILLIGLGTGKYVKSIERSVKQLGMDEREKELLGQEMLNAQKSKDRVIETALYTVKAKGVPVRFVITPHYAFLEGTSPYAILVRLSDVSRAEPEEEKKMQTAYGSQMKTHEFYTLHTIIFYKDGNVLNGMGFLQQELRDRALELIRGEMEQLKKS